MAAMNVSSVRKTEMDKGIEVMDKNGEVVGVSWKAGDKVGKGGCRHVGWVCFFFQIS